MLPVLCVLLLGLPQDAGKLTVTRVRPTLIDLGPTRQDTSYLPGDIMHVTFDVAGFQLDAESRYRFSARLSVEDSAGKVLGVEEYGISPARLGVIAGGKSRFSFRLPIPVDQASGNYKAKLVMTDVIGKSTITVEQSYKVLSPGFGLIRLQTGRGPFGQSETPASGVVGEVLYLGLYATGLSKGKEDKGSLDVTLEVQDSQGKTLGKPQTSTFTDLLTTEPVQLRFELPLDQAGKYQVVFKATDKVSSKTFTLSIPVTVID